MVVLLTGGTSGIGLAAAEKFASRGWKVYELSRREASSAAGGVHLRADLADRGSLEAAVAEVLRREGRIDALVNNAGMGIFGAAETTAESAMRRQFEVNFFGTVNLTQLVLPIMRGQGGGRIVNIASCAAFFPLPFQSFYSAAKAALVAWSRALSGEVAPFKIGVTVICPGDIKTGFTAARVSGRMKGGSGAALYDKAERHALDKAAESEQRGLDPEIVAEEIVRFAERKGPLVAIPGWQYALLDRLARLLPRTLVSRLIAKLYI